MLLTSVICLETKNLNMMKHSHPWKRKYCNDKGKFSKVKENLIEQAPTDR